jgi:hypothetical protein
MIKEIVGVVLEITTIGITTPLTTIVMTMIGIIAITMLIEMIDMKIDIVFLEEIFLADGLQETAAKEYYKLDRREEI